SNYTTPGWQRAQGRRTRRNEDGIDQDDDAGASRRNTSASWGRQARQSRGPLTIEGELVAKSTGTVSPFSPGDRVFHQKFGYGDVVTIEGNKLVIQFDKAGEKRVVDSFVQRA